MKSMRRKIALAAVAVIGTLAAVVSVTTASTVNIKPAGDTLLATSMNRSFTVGTAKIACEGTEQFEGKIPSPAEPSMKVEPTFSEKCSVSGLEGAKVSTFIFEPRELKTVSTTSGSIKLNGETSIILEGKTYHCFVGVTNETITGTWSTGKKGAWLATASTLSYAGVSIPIKVTGTGCPLNSVTSMPFSTTYAVNDITNITEPVVFE
jgi:hypothetical protein